MPRDPDLGHHGPGRCADCGHHSQGLWPGSRCPTCWSQHVRQRSDRAAAGPTALYHLYDQTGQLLYVGITSNPPRRWKEHRKTMAWWVDVDHTHTRIDWLDCGFRDASRHEHRAIWRGRPLANHDAGLNDAGEWVVMPLPPGVPERPRRPEPWDRRAYRLAWLTWRALWREAQLTAEEDAARRGERPV